MIEISAKVKAFLGQNPLPFYTNGAWMTGTSGKSIRVENPADKSVLAYASEALAADAEEAIEAADAAFISWRETSPAARARLLRKLADLCERDAEALAQLEALDVGKPVENARGFDVPFGIECLRYYADLCEKETFEQPLSLKGMKQAASVRLPYGVVGFIFPWNFPLTLCQWGIAPALAAGNTVVVKPSEVTPLSTLYLAKLADEAGFPAGVINVLPGEGAEVGALFTRHPKVRFVSFTGSSRVGRMVAETCGAHLKPVKLELGGKGASVVCDDADIPAAAAGLAGAITLNSGQVCCTATRWIVHEAVAPEFIERVKAELDKVTIKAGMYEDSQMGPLVNERQLKTVTGYIQQGGEQGAEVVYGGESLSDAERCGYYVRPTLLMGGEDNICFREEIFGPVAYITTFKEDADAIRQVNSLDYGLANSVWSTDNSRAMKIAKQMVSGNSWINAHNVFAYGLPYGAVNASGMGGGVNSRETMLDYTRGLSIAEPEEE